VAEFEAALAARPQDFGAWLGLGQALRRLGRADDAAAALARALALDPSNTDAIGALIDVEISRGDLAGAVVRLEAALRERPDWADALYNYGTVLMRLQRLGEAEAAFRRLITLDPGRIEAHRLLGGVLQRAARVDEMLEAYRAARTRFPGSFELESAELFGLSFSAEVTAQELFARHESFGRRLEKAIAARFAFDRRSRDPKRRLRVGFVSGDFRYHVVTLFMLPLAERLDRGGFELCCYSTGGVADALTRRLKARCDLWREAAAMSDLQLADAIHADGIDILVDLAGHSGMPRLGVFAQQPAPVQASWLGYLGTTGLSRIHYRITDAWCDPPGLTERLHTETLVRLPRSQWCYRPFVEIAPAMAPPAQHRGAVTFGSFNQAAKLSPSVRRLWAQILGALPGSRLLVAGVPDSGVREALLLGFADGGIERGRIAFRPYGSLEDYYRWYNEVDLALDTTLYSGGTTTLDGLWMGVPVLALPGERSASRSAAGILACLGMRDWIASSEEDYVRRAVMHASDLPRLAGLRRTLRARLRASPLMDAPGFARDMGDALRRMWQESCKSGERVS
jgi:predicted O-linked N-acetylglucosamine transferase (SPINDLY family)